MKKAILFLSLASIISATTVFAATTKPAPVTTAAAAPIPCATMASQVDAALKATKLKGHKLVLAEKHDKSGLALCKANKDKSADAQFKAALKLLHA